MAHEFIEEAIHDAIQERISVGDIRKLHSVTLDGVVCDLPSLLVDQSRITVGSREIYMRLGALQYDKLRKEGHEKPSIAQVSVFQTDILQFAQDAIRVGFIMAAKAAEATKT